MGVTRSSDCSGFAGNFTEEHLETRLPVGSLERLPKASAKAQAQLLEDEILHTGNAVVTSGDVVGISERFVVHRATSHYGMSGSAARPLTEPHTLIGIHLGTAGVLLFLA